MRARLRNSVIASWYGDSGWTRLLLPLAWLFGLVGAFRRRAYQQGLLAVPQTTVPVIVVGNITVGGTGKTPIVAWLATQLLARGYKPGIVSRGYGGLPAREPALVEPGMDSLLVGDEPVLLEKLTGCPVCVCIDRVAAVEALAARGVDVVIADDGLQHYRLRRDLEIVVIDAKRELGNGCLLPAGPLREGPGRLTQVDHVLLNGPGSEIAGVAFELQPGKLQSLSGGDQRELHEFAGRRVWMVAGIGNPGRFEAVLRAADIQVDAVAVPDHGRVSLESLRHQQPQPILMTEKDAVKYRGGANVPEDCWYLPVEVVFDSADQEAILTSVSKQLNNLVSVSEG